MVPPQPVSNSAGGGSSAVLIEGTTDDRWFIEAAPDDKRADGSFAAFSASCDDRMDDRYASLRLTLVSGGDSLAIAGAGRAGDRWVLVNYGQDAQSGNVRFTVQRPRRRFPRPLHEFEAEDFFQLWNEHPAELRQYLLPLLREMCGKNLVRPRAGDVYRAFATIPAAPDVVQKVAAFLPGLDAQGADERALTTQKIEALGPAGILAAVRFDRSELTPEQRGRLEALIQRASTQADPEAAARDPLFLADCLDDEDLRVRTAALDALRAVTGRQIAFDLSGDPIQRAKAAAALQESLQDAASPASGLNP